jgi:hypothetical protein
MDDLRSRKGTRRNSLGPHRAANVKNLMGTRPKAYFNATWAAGSGWEVGDRVADPEW